MRKIINRLNSKSLAVLVALFFLSACNSNILVDETRIVEEKVWRDQVFTFDFEITDTTRTYDVVLQLEHDSQFPYQNIYTEVTVTFPDATPPRVMPLSLDLADELGNWLGKCGSSTCQTPLAFMTNTKFMALGKHSLSFKQFSRLPEIEGLSKMRFQLIRLE